MRSHYDNHHLALWVVFAVALVLTMCVGRAHAADAGARALTWTGAPPPGSDSSWIFCDGALKTKVPTPAQTWTSADGFFAEGNHQCYVQAAANGAVIGGVSNIVNFTVAAAVVVAPVLSASGTPPLFTWNNLPGITSTRMFCDCGSGCPDKMTPVAAPGASWQTSAATFTPGNHSCSIRQMTGNSPGPSSNQVAFTIPPAVVVVPPVPFVLSVSVP